MGQIRALAMRVRRNISALPGRINKAIGEEIQKTNQQLKLEFPIKTGQARASFRVVRGVKHWMIINPAASRKRFEYVWYVIKKGTKRDDKNYVLPPMVEREESRLLIAIESKIDKLLSEVST